MLLKRHYVRKLDANGHVMVDAGGRVVLETEEDGSAKLDHIEVKHTGTTPQQNFSDTLVLNGLREGWLSIKGGVLTLHAQPEDLHYTIQRVPGKYPADNPAGYEVIHCYECVLDPQQHARFCAQAVKGGRRG